MTTVNGDYHQSIDNKQDVKPSIYIENSRMTYPKQHNDYMESKTNEIRHQIPQKRNMLHIKSAVYCVLSDLLLLQPFKNNKVNIGIFFAIANIHSNNTSMNTAISALINYAQVD